MTVFLYTFTEREKIYNLIEALDRRAVHHQLHAHWRRVPRPAAGLGRAMPRSSSSEVVANIDEIGKTAHAQPNFRGPHARTSA